MIVCSRGGVKNAWQIFALWSGRVGPCGCVCESGWVSVLDEVRGVWFVCA
jgi:hypothetical protein